MTLLVSASLSMASYAATVTWFGDVNSDWDIGLNWDSNLTPAAGDTIYMDLGTVDYSTGTSPNFRSLRLFDNAAMTVSGGELKVTSSAQWSDCLMNGTFVHTGGDVILNRLEMGSATGYNGVYQLNGGDLDLAREVNGFSLYLGTNRVSDAGGTATFQVVAGSMITRRGVKLGDASVAGIGTFEVIGSQASQIGIGTSSSGDGVWEQNAGSTLKVSIDRLGLTPIFIDDVQGTNGAQATFESGALLDVDFYNSGGPGTWTVMEVENGDITDNGLAFAPGVDTGIWSFNVDNSGPNGLLTVTSTAAAPTVGFINWTGTASSDWNDGSNWDNNAGPVTAGDHAVINSGTVVYTTASGPNLRALQLLGGTMTISSGLFKSTFGTTSHSLVDSPLYLSGGTVEINEVEVGGRSAGNHGSIHVSGGDFIVARGLGGYSLYLAADHDNNNGGTGLFEISGGILQTRHGVKLGHATQSGTGTFSVLGADSSEIGIGARTGDNDGGWTQNSGSVLKVGIDANGLTPIFLHDSAGDTTGTSATFESGALLDVSYYNNGGNAGTWTVMEVENGDIIDNGLAFAAGVDTSIWSFSIDNTGANGTLTVTSTATPANEEVVWVGSESSDWDNGLNWDNATGPYTQRDRAIINSGNVVYNEDNAVNLNALYLNGGTLTISGGLFRAYAQSNWDSRVASSLYHVGGTAQINELEIGSFQGETGFYYLSGGDLEVVRSLGQTAYSIYLGGNHDSSAGGTGTLEISSGSLRTRRGVKLGHESEAGTGTFTVLGSASSEIGIGSHGTGDGSWTQHADSTLKVGIDSQGVTKIFIDDVEGTNGTYATFESGALLDVDYYDTGESGGTWIVMEVENGDITDNGLAFAPGVDTSIWSFSVDNSGSNGVLRVTANGTPSGLILTVGNTRKQQMRYGIDYERLWFWQGSSSVRDKFAAWSVDDCDVDYVRVAINSKYELTEGVLQEDAYWDNDDNEGGSTNNDRIIPMMQDMQAANPDIKFFASPRPLDEAVNNVAWQPYPQWITGSSGSNSNYSFDEVKCSEYLLRYLILMKHHGFKISYMDLTNEWNYLNAQDVRDIKALFDDYLDGTKPVIHPDYPTVTLTADDIPQFVGPSAWSYSQGRSWMSGVQYGSYREALSIASCHNTDKGGSAQSFADRVHEMYDGKSEPVPEIWNTEVHGWKSTSDADEVLTFAYMMECINAGFSGLNGWLAIGFSNQGHCYIVNNKRSVKYYMFKKLTNTSNRGFALDVNEPGVFKDYWDSDPDQADADSAVSALIRGNLMTVWVLNHSDTDHPVTIVPSGRTISDEPIKFTRWSQFDGLPVEGETGTIATHTDSYAYVTIQDNSAYCYEILLEPESVPYAHIEAENFDGSNPAAHSTESCTDVGGGLNLSNINEGNWTRYDDIDLSHATDIRLRISRPAGRPDGVIEIRTGSPTGPRIGKTAVPETGDWQNWSTIETPLEPTSGTHDLYLVYVEAKSNESGTGAMFNLNWFELIQTQTPTSIAETPISGTEITLTWNAVPGAVGYTVKRSTTQGGSYTIIDDTITGTTYTDTGLNPGSTYYYVIVARYADGEESDASGEVVAVPSDPIVMEDLDFQLPNMNLAGDNVGIQLLNSKLGHLYQGQEKKDLTMGDWVDIGDPILGNGGVITFNFPVDPSDTKCFYRISVSRQ